MNLDWTDIALHAGAGAGVVLIVAFGGVWGAAIANAAFWPAREALQCYDRGRAPWDWRGSPQKHLEAWLSPVIGLALAALLQGE